MSVRGNSSEQRSFHNPAQNGVGYNLSTMLENLSVTSDASDTDRNPFFVDLYEETDEEDESSNDEPMLSAVLASDEFEPRTRNNETSPNGLKELSDLETEQKQVKVLNLDDKKRIEGENEERVDSAKEENRKERNQQSTPDDDLISQFSGSDVKITTNSNQNRDHTSIIDTNSVITIVLQKINEKIGPWGSKVNDIQEILDIHHPEVIRILRSVENETKETKKQIESLNVKLRKKTPTPSSKIEKEREQREIEEKLDENQMLITNQKKELKKLEKNLREVREEKRKLLERISIMKKENEGIMKAKDERIKMLEGILSDTQKDIEFFRGQNCGNSNPGFITPDFSDLTESMREMKKWQMKRDEEFQLVLRSILDGENRDSNIPITSTTRISTEISAFQSEVKSLLSEFEKTRKRLV